MWELILQGGTDPVTARHRQVSRVELPLANRDLLHRNSVMRFHDAIAWLAQIGMFLVLGLLVFPSRLPEVAGRSIVVALVLMLVARPVATLLMLTPFRVPLRHQGVVGWVGLRGATPIILATFPLVEGIPEAQLIFDAVFFVVLTSILVHGDHRGVGGGAVGGHGAGAREGPCPARSRPGPGRRHRSARGDRGTGLLR